MPGAGGTLSKCTPHRRHPPALPWFGVSVRECQWFWRKTRPPRPETRQGLAVEPVAPVPLLVGWAVKCWEGSAVGRSPSDLL